MFLSLLQMLDVTCRPVCVCHTLIKFTNLLIYKLFFIADYSEQKHHQYRPCPVTDDHGENSTVLSLGEPALCPNIGE